MVPKNTAIFCIVLLVDQTIGILKLPQINDNRILSTDSTVYNHLLSFTLQDYNNLKEISKLTRVDNKKSNETENFMTAINDLLNEDMEETDFGDVKDNESVKYINQFLNTLEKVKQEFEVNRKKYEINKDLYQVSKNDDVLSINSTKYFDTSLDYIGVNDTLHIKSEFWKPDPIIRRIYAGDRVKIKRFPFMASIQIFNKFHCGGCIIDDDLIITAASCLQLAWNNRFFRENPSFLSVRVGSTFYTGGGENIPVLEVYFHPNYNPRNLWNNLCILRLVRKLVFRRKEKRIKKINFDRSAYALPMMTEGITIIGWGARGVNNILKNPWENQLAYTVLDVYLLVECREIYSMEYVTRRHFCAGFLSKGSGACNHDVGGPGIANGVLTGIVSFGSPLCGTPDAPTVFTKLGFYTDWIESIMDQDVKTFRKKTTITSPRTFDSHTIGHDTTTTTSFEIEPLGVEMTPIPITDDETQADTRLRELLKTMFQDDAKVDYKDLLKEIISDERDLDPANVQGAVAPVLPILDTDQLQGHSEQAIVDYLQIATEMGVVDPQDIDVEVSTTPLPPLTAPLLYNDNINRDNKLTNVDESLEELIKQDNELDKFVNLTTDIKSLKGKKKRKNKVDFVRIVNDKDLEKHLANILSELDLKKIIESVRSGEDTKALDDKIMNLYKEKEIDKMSDDDSLTLLYLSDSEKRTLRQKSEKLGLIQEYTETDEGEGNAESQKGGMSIDVNAFKDWAYRSGLNSSDNNFN